MNISLDVTKFRIRNTLKCESSEMSKIMKPQKLIVWFENSIMSVDKLIFTLIDFKVKGPSCFKVIGPSCFKVIEPSCL